MVVFLKTPGGVAESVENIVGIMRFHYSHLIFVVPDYAMSAGTILCMAGNEIYMDYASSLGPIDPQVVIGDSLVPALGYLEQYETMIEKSRHGDLTDAEFLLLNQQDLAVLHSIEQAKELTITLLKKWLVEHKFSNWDVHKTDITKKGQTVTLEEKEERAKEIASELSNIRKWHSHNRAIGIEALTKELRLQIEDYSKKQELRNLIRDYFDLLVAYIERHNFSFFLHSRTHF